MGPEPKVVRAGADAPRERLREQNALRGLVREVRDACLYDEDDGTIGVTSEPTIDSDLFDRLCAALRAGKQRGGGK